MAGEYRNHAVAVRYRVTGSGAFQSTLIGLDPINTYTVPTVTLAAATEKYPNQLVNFIQQKMQLEFYVDTLNAAFILKQIQIYLKPVASGYPQ